jgi:predicted transcriptional regulator
MAEPVLARIIIEMLGAPQDYITKTMHAYVEKLKTTHAVLKTEIAPAEARDKIFSIYAELEMRFADLPDLFDFCFEAMPSSVEVVEPAEFSLKLDKLNAFLNDLQARLHEADAIIKTERIRQQMIDMNTTNVFRRFLLHLAERGHSTASEMSHYVGVQPTQLIPFLDKLVEEKKLKKDGDQYTPHERAQEPS